MPEIAHGGRHGDGRCAQFPEGAAVSKCRVGRASPGPGAEFEVCRNSAHEPLAAKATHLQHLAFFWRLGEGSRLFQHLKTSR